MKLGQLRVWNVQTRQCVYEQKLPESRLKKEDNSEVDVHSIAQAFLVPSIDKICASDQEHNVQLYSTDNLSLHKQVLLVVMPSLTLTLPSFISRTVGLTSHHNNGGSAATLSSLNTVFLLSYCVISELERNH